MSRQLQNEQEHHLKFFEYYYSLGESRSYKKVAVEMHVSVAAIKLIAASFDWKHRVHERDLECARQLADRTLHTAMEDHTRYRKVVRMAIMKLAKAISEDRVKLQGADLDRLIRLDAFLTTPAEGNELSIMSSAAEIAAFIEDLPTYILKEIEVLMDQKSAGETAGTPTPNGAKK